MIGYAFQYLHGSLLAHWLGCGKLFITPEGIFILVLQMHFRSPEVQLMMSIPVFFLGFARSVILPQHWFLCPRFVHHNKLFRGCDITLSRVGIRPSCSACSPYRTCNQPIGPAHNPRTRTHPIWQSFRTKKFAGYALWRDTLSGSSSFMLLGMFSLLLYRSTNPGYALAIGEGGIGCK